MNTFAIGREGCSLVEAEWNSRGLLWAGVLSSVFAPACLQFTFQLRGNLPAPSTCPLCCFQLWDALSSFRSCLWFSMWNMDYFTVSIGHSFKMRVSLFPSLPSPPPQVTASSMKTAWWMDPSLEKIYMSTGYANAEKRWRLPTDHCEAKLSERTRARPCELWGGSGQGVAGSLRVVQCTRSLGYISIPAILESG